MYMMINNTYICTCAVNVKVIFVATFSQKYHACCWTNPLNLWSYLKHQKNTISISVSSQVTRTGGWHWEFHLFAPSFFFKQGHNFDTCPRQVQSSGKGRQVCVTVMNVRKRECKSCVDACVTDFTGGPFLLNDGFHFSVWVLNPGEW